MPAVSLPKKSTAVQKITRTSAISREFAHYFTGVPCKHGHISPRSVKNRHCLECDRLKAKEYASSNPSKMRTRWREYSAKQYAENEVYREKCKARARKQTTRLSGDPENTERKRVYKAEWRDRNREKVRASTKSYVENNRAKIRAKNAKRRAREAATSDPNELQDIEKFYASCPDGCHVDHIIPLAKGGRHVLSNLQYLLARDNLMKGSKMPTGEIRAQVPCVETRSRQLVDECGEHESAS